MQPFPITLPDRIFSKAMPWDILSMLEMLIRQQPLSQSGTIAATAILDSTNGPILIEEGASIEHGCYIYGPCYIGKNVTVRHGALIRPHTWIGENAVIGHCSEVKHSIVGANSKLPHFNYVGDSLIGTGVNMGAGAVATNVRLDKQPIFVRLENQQWSTGKRKFGAIIGDYASIGAHVVLNPGQVVPAHARLLP